MQDLWGVWDIRREMFLLLGDKFCFVNFSKFCRFIMLFETKAQCEHWIKCFGDGDMEIYEPRKVVGVVPYSD